MLKKYFVAGLLIWLPLAATLWVLDFIVSTMDRTLLLLPQGWRPMRSLGSTFRASAWCFRSRCCC